MKIKNLTGLIIRIRKLFRTATERLHVTSPSTSFDLYEEGEEDEVHPVLLTLGYTLGEKLGEGSFSYVARAHSEKHRRDVAIKIIKRRHVPKLYMEKRLPREIKLIKVLNHENILKFLNITKTKSFVYVIMNLAVNGNLLETVQKNGYIDEKRACRWFHHLVEGIAFCHWIGIAHRDLKCENLLLDERNILKITDFTLARGHLPQYVTDNKGNLDRKKVLSSTFCGSYAYACPEILFRVPYEPHLSDVWSMGIVLYVMVSGHLPFDDTNLHILLQDIRKPVKFLKHPDLSKDVEQLIVQILSPAKIRIYIPKIKENKWYINMFAENLEYEWSEESSSCTVSSFSSSLSGNFEKARDETTSN